MCSFKQMCETVRPCGEKMKLRIIWIRFNKLRLVENTKELVVIRASENTAY